MTSFTHICRFGCHGSAELRRDRRARRGEYSAEACYHDSFDYDALHRVLLDPLGPSGDRRFQQAVFDYRTDTALSQPVTTAPADAVLLFDGVFLLRPELIDRWDLRIFGIEAVPQLVRRAASLQALHCRHMLRRPYSPSSILGDSITASLVNRVTPDMLEAREQSCPHAKAFLLHTSGATGGR
jgi:hypothetical protein